KDFVRDRLRPSSPSLVHARPRSRRCPMRIARRILALSLLTCLVAPVGSANAQVRFKKQPDFQPDIQNVDGYMVRIFRMQRGSYGYEIDHGSQVLIHQRRNPYTGSLQGLRKADARTTAMWVLENIVKTDRMRPRDQRAADGISLSRYIPPTVASELGITLDTNNR